MWPHTLEWSYLSSPCAFPEETHRIDGLGGDEQRYHPNRLRKRNLPERISEHVDVESGRLDSHRLPSLASPMEMIVKGAASIMKMLTEKRLRRQVV